MNAKTLGILVGATALLVIVAIVSVSGRGTSEVEEHGLLVPGLEAKLNGVTTITVAGEETFTLERGDEGWTVREKGGYPADTEKVRAALINLSRLERVESKTASADRYDRLGVGGAGRPDSSVIALDAGGERVAAVILGKTDMSAANRRYARNEGDAGSWLVEGRLDLQPDAMDWVDREILRIQRDEIASVTIEHPDGDRLVAHRVEAQTEGRTTDFVVDEIPQGFQLTRANAANGLGSLLSFLRMEDVRPIPGEVRVGIRAVIATFDGLIVTVRLSPEESGTWITLEAWSEAAPPPGEGFVPDHDQPLPPPEPDVQAVIDRADELNRRLAAWSFRVSDSTAATFSKRVADYTEPVPPAEPAEGEGEAGGEGGDSGGTP